jgi:lipoprotein-anchoring transpeptidase ErfK/SrfK
MDLSALTPSIPTQVAVLPTATLEASVTPSATLTPSLTPSPEVTGTQPPEQIEATGIAQTNTAAALLDPITQTMGAISQGTNAAATLTATAASPTPLPSATIDPAAEPFQAIYYGNSNGNDDIYLMTLNGVHRRLTGSLANEREPSCAPDGSWFVFASDVSGAWQIYSQPFNQNEAVQLTDSEGINFAPIFSPDGATIAFVSTRNQGIPTIWLMDADGSNQRQLTTELGRDTAPSWGPDGRVLLFSGDQVGTWDIFITVLENDLEGEFPLMPPEMSGGNELWPSFDPLEERVIYTQWGDLNDPQTADIYMLDFEENQPVPVRAESGADIAWAWADDTHIFASVGGPDDIQIALVDVTTGEAVPLTDSGTNNGGARLCTVQPSALAAEPTAAPSPTPSSTPTIAPPSPTPSPTLTPTPEPPAVFSPELMAAAGGRYTVKNGETLATIANNYNMAWELLADLNGLVNPDSLTVGQQLIVPVSRTGHRQGGYQLPDSDLTGEVAELKYIRVDLSMQQMYAYENGHVVRTSTVSTGLAYTPTVQGDYHIYRKVDAQLMTGPGYYLPAVPYVMYFYRGYALHGAYWHDNFGQPASHGCVNISPDEARWFYNWADIGTLVSIQP